VLSTVAPTAATARRRHETQDLAGAAGPRNHRGLRERVRLPLAPSSHTSRCLRRARRRPLRQGSGTAVRRGSQGAATMTLGAPSLLGWQPKYTPMTAEVLIIDDDTRLYELVAKYLSQNGVLSQHAGDGGAGLRALSAGSFDAVFLDIMMPGLDGLEVLRRIRAKSKIGRASRRGSLWIARSGGRATAGMCQALWMR